MSEAQKLVCPYVGYDYVTENSSGITYSSNHPAYFNIEEHETWIIKFKTPGFIGVPRDMQMTFRYTELMSDVDQFRYAITTSDVNWKKYSTDLTDGDVGDVSEPYQIARGEFVLSDTADSTLTIENGNLEPNTTYYLILWDFDSSGRLYTNSTFIWINVFNGLVYIDNGTELAAYQPYIDNGSGWDMVIPHVDNGNSWDMCS